MQILAGTAIFNKEGKILLLQQKEDGPQRLLWGPPAGHGEENEDPKDTAIRETKEETNLDIKLTNLVQAGVVNIFDGSKYLFFTYKADVKDLSQLKIDPIEVKDYGWFSLDDIKEEKIKLRGSFLKEPLMKAFSNNVGKTDQFVEYFYTKDEADSIRV